MYLSIRIMDRSSYRKSVSWVWRLSTTIHCPYVYISLSSEIEYCTGIIADLALSLCPDSDRYVLGCCLHCPKVIVMDREIL